MKAYLAGPLWKEQDRAYLEQIDALCKELGYETYLPHRDIGVYQQGDSNKFFVKNRDMVDWADVIVAVLDWKYIGSGTAWEIGYAHAKKVPVIGIVEDMDSITSTDRLCVMNFNSVKMVDTLEKLKQELLNLTASSTR
jgi:nucleoside 2-deoxyribosyltransferase